MGENFGATLIAGGDSDIAQALLERLNGEVIAHVYAAPERPKQTRTAAHVTTVPGDLSTAEGISEFIEAVKATSIPISKLVFMPAAPAAPARLRDFDPARFGRDMNIGCLSAAMLLSAFLPAMAKHRFGRVAAMLTIYCIGVPPKYLASYVTTKYALMGLLKAAAAEYADKGITVNAVAPSMVETGFLATLPDFEIEQSARRSPAGRNATPADIAPVLELLLSDESEYISGAVIPITAGGSF